jgi:hypothetical protein
MTATPTPVNRRRGVSVDWVYIRYRTVGYLAGLLIAAGIGLVGWWWISSRLAPDEARATAAIRSAEALVAEASAHDPDAQQLSLARAHLDRARQELGAASYGPAVDEARAADSLAREALALRTGDGAPSVRLVRIEGDVRVKRAGQFLWDRASEQMLLEANDQIRTGADGSAQLVYFDGSVMTLGSGTLLELRDLHRDPQGREQRVSERLAWGAVEGTTDAKNGTRSIHELATDSASVRASEGSQFRIRHDRERGESEVVSLGGDVVVRTPRGEIPLEKNTRIALSGGEVVDRGKLLEAPRQLGPPDQKTFLGASETRVGLAWSQVEGTRNYHLQLSDRSMFTRTILDMEHVQSTEMELPPLAPGSYYWRVAAVDRSGRSGQWSSVRRFRLMGAEFSDPEDGVPPPLDVSEILVVGTNAIITGCAEPGALVWIEGERVDLRDDGCFNWVIKLREDGQNKLQFLAQDAAGNETRRVGYAYVDVF